MRAVIAVALIGLGASAADADPTAVTVELQPVELVFAAADTNDDMLIAATGAAAAREQAASGCFAKVTGTANAVALITVDKKGKTTKILVGGTGDAKLDRCLEKAIKPTAWPASSRGGAIVLTIANGKGAQASSGTSDSGEMVGELLQPGAKDDAGALARVTSGPTMAVGTIEGSTTTTYHDRVAEKLRAKASSFRRCYSNALKQDPNLAGKLLITFTIGGDGKVIAASATTSLLPDVDNCVISAITAIKFPSPPDGNAVDIKLPINYASQ